MQLSRRRPGQSGVTTSRREDDEVLIQSGVENGLTLGTPIALLVENKEMKKSDYNMVTLTLSISFKLLKSL